MPDPIALADLLTTWANLPFEPFRTGVDIHHIRRGEPALAILRYAPGAKVPLHLHTGLETILVLDGVQCDERGSYGPGALVLNPEGSTHSVWSDTGCAVLIQWERPVKILQEDTP
jgi:anti-sigma factor ChrR (cupin superfamily)